MPDKGNQPYPPEGEGPPRETPAQMEAWAGQFFRVLEKIAETAARERAEESRLFPTEAEPAVISFKDLDRRLETLPAQ